MEKIFKRQIIIKIAKFMNIDFTERYVKIFKICAAIFEKTLTKGLTLAHIHKKHTSTVFQIFVSNDSERLEPQNLQTGFTGD